MGVDDVFFASQMSNKFIRFIIRRDRSRIVFIFAIRKIAALERLVQNAFLTRRFVSK